MEADPYFAGPSLQKFAFYMGCLNNVGLWALRDDFDEGPSVAETLKQQVEVSQGRRPGKIRLTWGLLPFLLR
jgi:hypothetical protein